MMTSAEDRRITSLIVGGREPSRAVIYSRRVRKRGQGTVECPMLNVGLVIGFKVVCRKAPRRVLFTDFSNEVRINTPGYILRPFEDGFLVPLAYSQKDLRGAIFASVVFGRATLTLFDTPPGPLSIEQLYYEWTPISGSGGLQLPLLSLNVQRRIINDRDEMHFSSVVSASQELKECK